MASISGGFEFLSLHLCPPNRKKVLWHLGQGFCCSFVRVLLFPVRFASAKSVSSLAEPDEFVMGEDIGKGDE